MRAGGRRGGGPMGAGDSGRWAPGRAGRLRALLSAGISDGEEGAAVGPGHGGGI